MLCHKWKVVSMQMQGKQFPAEGEEMYITFLPDGTFVDSQEGHKASGKWTYVHSTMTVTTGGIAKKILKIDDKQLQFKSKMDGQIVIVTVKRVD